MEAGFSTATQKVREMGFGAGMGLPNIKRNADILNISSEPGKGTSVEIIVFLKP
jgi:anti-sigma regulatory factor (Ser/Thr protein kinase)